MDLKNIHRVYFIGVGGIGMSAIARYFCENGKQVAGYDKTPSEITDTLILIGVQIHFEDNVALIPEDFKKKGRNANRIYTCSASES